MTNPKLEVVTRRYLAKKLEMNQVKAELKDIAEEIDGIMGSDGLSEYGFKLEDESTVNLRRRTKEKDKLDKPGLAEELDLETKQLNMNGMVELAEAGKLTKQHLKDHTFKDRKIELKIKVRKPKKKKGDQIQ